MNAPYLIAVLVTIGVPLVAIYLIYASDLFGTGKLSTFVLSALWGALGAYLIADVVNNRVLLPRLGYETVVGLAGPIVEEIAKALLLIYLVTR
ncbi:MAG: hypothetical protein IT323_04515, partial [Anaerolineae bacterium]|nr:hypothetical protein [Anaerolineae bacterium]